MLLEREAPLAQLRLASQKAQNGHGSVVIVSGEAGVGKSTLLRTFANADNGCDVYWGCSDPLFTPCPLGPLHDMVEMLDAGLATLVHNRAAPDIIFQSLISVLQKGDKTRLLIFEDVHWADDATLDLIRYIGRRIAFLRCVLVLTLRSEEAGVGFQLPRVIGDLPTVSTARIPLLPLSREGIEQLIGECGLNAEELFAITAGNPFFATELIANLQPGPGGIPVSVRDAVWARLERLNADELRVLEAISIAPSGAEDWFAEALLLEDVTSVLSSCEARGLLVLDKEERYRFRHELARQATLERLTSNAQKVLHQRAYEVLATRPSFPLPCMVHHAAGAGDAAKVLELAPLAAAEAARLGAHKEAATHLESALQYAGSAEPELQAQLNEEWAYEAGLVLQVEDSVIAATQSAIGLWSGMGRKDKVARNLCRLSRLHWLRGEGAQAVHFAEEAIAALDGEPPGQELAMAYGVRAQLLMFDDRFVEARALSEKALALAEELDDIETKVHALNNIASALLYSGDSSGKPIFDESLKLSLEHGLHEQSLRVYVNYAEYAIFGHEFDLAERIVEEGIAFCTHHDLDFGIYYVLGRQAQLRMEQGRFREAETIANGVLAVDRLTMVAKLPARLVLARTRVRTGQADADMLMRLALDDALKTEEQQNIVPARFGMIEAAWLRGDLADAQAHLSALLTARLEGMAPWDVGEFAVWWRRCKMTDAFPLPDARMVSQRADELAGNFERASKLWQGLGLPYEAALVLLQTPQGAADSLQQLADLGAVPAASLARSIATEAGIALKPNRTRRGPYGAAKHHPLGLSNREIQILELVAEGLGNGEIASRLFRSQRTIEHHVSAIFAKLNVSSRMDAMLRLRNEPWLAHFDS